MSDNNSRFLEKLDIYRDKLLELGKSNRSICLGRLYNKHNFDLARLLEKHPKTIKDLVDQSFKRKKPVCILPDSDESEEADVMRKHLKDLSRNIKQLEDETGAQYCYFGFPFLEGHLDKEHYLRGPLVLFPISVYSGKKGTVNGWFVKFSDVSPIFNYTMFTALEKIGGYTIDANLESALEDIMSMLESAGNRDHVQFIDLISAFLTGMGLQLESGNLESANSTPQLVNITRVEIEELDTVQLGISNYKIIGSFPQGESAIYHDYENLISKINDGEKNDFIEDILDVSDSPAEFDEDNNEQNLEDLDQVSDTDLNLILPSDSSQDHVVLSSQNQKITLVRGPPGTGKSQVIVNVIANALSKKQTVLVVCQKRAALQVVHQRLGEMGLDRYAVLLDKEKEDRARMYQQLKQILESPDPLKNDEKQILKTTSNNIDVLIKRFSEIAFALSKPYFGGITIRDLYTKSSFEYSRKLDLEGIANEIQYPDLDRFLHELSANEANFKKFENASYPWKNRKDFSKRSASDKNKIKVILENILSKSKNCIILSHRMNQDTFVDLANKHSKLNSKIAQLNKNNDTNTKSTQKLLDTYNMSVSLGDLDESVRCVDAGVTLWNRFQNYDQVKKIKEDHIVEDSKEKQQKLLESFSILKEKQSFWKKLTDSETKRKQNLQKSFLQRPENAGKNSADLQVSLKNGLDLWELVVNPLKKQYLFEKSFILPNKSDQDQLLQNLQKMVADSKLLMADGVLLKSTVKSLGELFEKNDLQFDESESMLTLALNGKEILGQIGALSEFINKKETENIFKKSSNPDKLSLHIQNLLDCLPDFDSLQALDSRKVDLSPTLQKVLNRCVLKIAVNENWADTIKQEIFHYWIEIIEQDHPILKAGYFDDYKQNQKRLSELMDKKSDLLVRKIIHTIESSVDFLPGMGNKRTKRETEYNALRHELGKKRKVKPVRILLEEYEHILFDIAPCWLASPEMVSNIFPLEQNIFDLVIVDEASQLAAERALPFLYRGERLVIAGDEKQLKPNNLFRVKEVEDEDEQDDTINIESLLVLAKRRYSAMTLRWHYRSRWQQLIDFSNHAFYHGMLQISPNVHLKTDEPPIRWVDCPGGMWENRSNIAEAAKVVDVLHGILQDYKKKKEMPTIGIITFNDQQRNIIMDEIEIRCKTDPAFENLYKKIEMPASGKKDDEIFIRNIENVQGDERDIIIFSIGYAKDREGKFRLSFGTLNQDGGENRLNVAVTRASQKIIVVCSIDPRDMKVEGTKNPGPKRLKDFLVYARAVSDGDTEKVGQLLDSFSSGMNQTRSQTKQFDSEFEELVHDRLEARGFSVDTQVGQSGYRIDLAVVHPNDSSKYILGIECDGAMFHSGKSVRERDVMRQKFLERRGWNIDRIWSRNWWRDPDREVQRIQDKIKLLVESS